MPDSKTPEPTSLDESLTSAQKIEMFKFYEEAAEKAKAHAWSQTTWILTLNAGILAFSLTFFAEHRDVPAFLIVELLAAAVGLVLSGFLIYLLYEFGSHIRNYWTRSNKIAAGYFALQQLVSEENARKAEGPHYRVQYPKFCLRLQILAGFFAIAHIGWAAVVAVASICSA